MKISNREKIMLCALGIVAIGFIYYKFGYLNEKAKIELKTKERNEIEERYNKAKETINSLEDKKSDVKILKSRIDDKSLPFYPIISEEHIILELDKLLVDSQLEGSIKFEPIVSETVESMEWEKSIIKESTLETVVDEYKNIIGNTEDPKEDFKSDNDEGSNNAIKSKNQVSKSNTSNDVSSSSNNSENNENTAYCLKGSINFTGNYEGIIKFLNSISNYDKKIVVSNISINESGLDEITGAMNIEIYAVPKIDDEIEEYLKWELNNTYGKEIPFSSSESTGFQSLGSDIVSDFDIVVKSINSDLPTIMIRKLDDAFRNTYVYADSNEEEIVEMELTQEGDKYYYKYKTGKGSLPSNYNDSPIEFVPISQGNIVIDILSEVRVNNNDRSAIKLNLINKTDRLVSVNISGDDESKPRVTISGDGSNISINKQ